MDRVTTPETKQIWPVEYSKKKRWRKDGIMRKMPCHSLINETK